MTNLQQGIQNKYNIQNLTIKQLKNRTQGPELIEIFKKFSMYSIIVTVIKVSLLLLRPLEKKQIISFTDTLFWSDKVCLMLLIFSKQAFFDLINFSG